MCLTYCMFCCDESLQRGQDCCSRMAAAMGRPYGLHFGGLIYFWNQLDLCFRLTQVLPCKVTQFLGSDANCCFFLKDSIQLFLQQRKACKKQFFKTVKSFPSFDIHGTFLLIRMQCTDMKTNQFTHGCSIIWHSLIGLQFGALLYYFL